MDRALSFEESPHDEAKINRRKNFLSRLPEYIKKDIIKSYGFDREIYTNYDSAEILARFLSDDEYENIYLKYRFAGKRTTNLFFIRNLAKMDMDIDKLLEYFKKEGETIKIDVVDAVILPEKKIIILSVLKELPSYSWETDEIYTVPEYYFVIFRDGSNLIEIRGSDFYKANEIFNKIRDFLFKEGGKNVNAFRLDINNPKFKEEFEKYVKEIWHARIKLETANDSVGEISLKSRVNPESKKREDLRVSRKYAEIMEEGGDVLVAYIVFQKDDREVNFQINFRSSRISF